MIGFILSWCKHWLRLWTPGIQPQKGSLVEQENWRGELRPPASRRCEPLERGIELAAVEVHLSEVELHLDPEAEVGLGGSGLQLGQPAVFDPFEPGYVWLSRSNKQTCPRAAEPKPLISKSYLRMVLASLTSSATGAKKRR